MPEELKAILKEKADKGEYSLAGGKIDIKKFLDSRDYYEKALSANA